MNALGANNVVTTRALDSGAVLSLEFVASRAVKLEAGAILQGVSGRALDSGALSSDQLLVGSAGDAEADVSSLDLTFTASNFLASTVDELVSGLAGDGDTLGSLQSGSLRAVGADLSGSDGDSLLAANTVLELVAWWARDDALSSDGDLGANQTNSVVSGRAVLDALDVLVVGEAFWAAQSLDMGGGDLARAAAFLLGAPALAVPSMGRNVGRSFSSTG